MKKPERGRNKAISLVRDGLVVKSLGIDAGRVCVTTVIANPRQPGMSEASSDLCQCGLEKSQCI